jgi:hypothetical protein
VRSWWAQVNTSWVYVSLALWLIDLLTTVWALDRGAVEGNPWAAAAHTKIGVVGYGFVLLVPLAARGIAAGMPGRSLLTRSVRLLCQISIVIHVVVVANNFCVIVASYFGPA